MCVNFILIKQITRWEKLKMLEIEREEILQKKTSISRGKKHVYSWMFFNIVIYIEYKVRRITHCLFLSSLQHMSLSNYFIQQIEIPFAIISLNYILIKEQNFFCTKNWWTRINEKSQTWFAIRKINRYNLV